MNTANKLTLIRISLVPVLVLFMYMDNLWTRICALLIFTVAAVTDIYDGAIARKQHKITTVGIFLDPLADKLLMSAAFISFVGLRELHVPAWMVIVITSREFIITGLRSIAAAQNVVISASKTGKLKTTSQVVAVITLMVVLITNSALWNFAGLRPIYFLASSGFTYLAGWCLVKLPYWMMLLTTILTVYSGSTYLLEHLQLLKEK